MTRTTRTFLSLALLAATATALAGCGVSVNREREVTTETKTTTVDGETVSSTVTGKSNHDLAGMENFEIHGKGDVKIVQGTEESLTIRTHKDNLPFITVSKGVDPTESSYYRAGDLKRVVITVDSRKLPKKRAKIQFDLNVKQIASLKATGAVDVESDAIRGRELALDLSGAVDVDLKNVKVQTLKASASGSTDLTLSGTATKQSFTASGATDINAENLRGDNCSFSGSGAVDAKLNCKRISPRSLSGAVDLSNAE